MNKRIIFSSLGICVLVAGVGTGTVIYLSHNKPNQAVSDRVTTSSYGSGLSVTNSSSSNGLQQSTLEKSDSSQTATNSSTVSSTVPSNALKLLDPSTFKQYDTQKYLQGTTAFYTDLQLGTGATLNKPGQKAAILYKGWLTSGAMFDKTQVNAQGQNITYSFVFDANPPQVIAGFDEGLAGMKVGGVRLFIIPPAAAYGSEAHGPIPANSVLIFQVQLMEIQ